MAVFKGPEAWIRGADRSSGRGDSGRAIGVVLAVGSSLMLWLGLAMLARCVVRWFA